MTLTPGLGRNERGTALPVAMVLLVIATSLTVVFSSLATTEPMLARNQVMSAQARALAESGLERAVWALSNPEEPYGIPSAMGTSAGSPYDGTAIAVNGAGSMLVTVTRPVGGLPDNERVVVGVGTATGQGEATRKIQATVMQFRWTSESPPCALCVKGKLAVGGSSEIDARGNHCAGSTPIGGTASTNTTTAPDSPTAPAKIYGPDDEVANETSDKPQSVDESSLEFLGPSDFDTLRALAKARGTYLTGPQHFTSAPPTGLVFVDLETGTDLTPSTDPDQVATVTLSGEYSWTGWLIAAGDIVVSGKVNLTGMLYAQNDFIFTGTGQITGAVFANNLMATMQSAVAATTGGSSKIVYDCQAARDGGGTMSTTGWFVKPGTFVELSGS